MSESKIQTDQEGFIRNVVKRAGKYSHLDFTDEGMVINNIQKVFDFLDTNIPENKMNIIKANFSGGFEKNGFIGVGKIC